MAFIKPGQWNRYKNIINAFHGDANQDTLVWRPQLDYIPVNGEDEAFYTNAPTLVQCLFHYNYFRTWPIIGYTINGEVDKQSCVAIMNIAYLKTFDPPILDANNRLIYKPDHDVFEHRGDKYIATGDTFISQANNEPLLFMLILKRMLNEPNQIQP